MTVVNRINGSNFTQLNQVTKGEEYVRHESAPLFCVNVYLRVHIKRRNQYELL